MNLHEYQAKEILNGFGVRIQRGYVASTPDIARRVNYIRIIFNPQFF